MTGIIAKYNTYIMSNIAPQFSTHNNEDWKKWEAYTIRKAENVGVVFVITGVTGQLDMLVDIFI